MVYTGQPSKGCATCRKRRIKCDEQIPECGACKRIKQECPGYKNHFDLAWRDQTTVAKKGVERGKAKRKAAREREEQARTKPDTTPIHAPTPRYAESSNSSVVSRSPNQVFTPISRRSDSSPSSTTDSPAAYDVSFRSFTSHSEADPYLTLLRPIPEEQALCFFFNNFILPVRDPLARRGFLEHLGPFYANAKTDSPLKMSTMAVASCMMSSGMGRPSDSPLARTFYLRAVSEIKGQIMEQKNCLSDELIVAVMLLQLYEASIGYLMQRTSNPHPHLDGALALIRHRGPKTFSEPVSRSILFYVRSLLIEEALRSATPIPTGVQEWTHLLPESEVLPGVRLDTINLDLANLRAATLSMSQSPTSKETSSLIRGLLKDASDIDQRLSQWHKSIPDSWLPTRVYADQGITSTLQLYQGHCDVYKTMFVAGLWNKLRLSQIEIRFTILTLLDHLPATSTNMDKQIQCSNETQQIADDICASVPYYIGDRMRPGRAGEPGINYPRISGKPPIIDHYQTGPALGGWSLIVPLSTLMRMRIHLREGQRDWIAGQMGRTARIYNINLVKKG